MKALLAALLHVAGIDPDDIRTDSLPRPLRPLHRAYVYVAVRVTGHAAHALNGVLVWLLIGGPLWLPLGWWWVVPMAFFTLREIPDLVRGRGDWLDHLGDVAWVYAVGVALWAPPDLLLWFMAPTACVQLAYWCEPAPAWMPRESLLWGKR
ncbi:MAG: hypothetical protein AMXMBFR53_36450 [Gemmatimonadota bacterium]